MTQENNHHVVSSPVFIVGPGRSGTTMFYHMLALHPHLAWPSNWTTRFPKVPQLAALGRLNDLPSLNSFLIKQTGKWPSPSEAIDLWEHYFPGYRSLNDQKWDSTAVEHGHIQRVREFVSNLVRWQGKRRFLAKRTGYPMFNWIRTLFPSARILYINRDPRAVVMSRLKQKWGFKNNLEAFNAMPLREKLDLYADQFLREHETKKQYGNEVDYLQVFYEELIADPVTQIERICEYCELPFDSSYHNIIKDWPVKTTANGAWMKKLSDPEDREYLNYILREPLEELGYTSAEPIREGVLSF